MFYNESCKMSQENKMRIRKYVHHSRQSNELGRRGGFSDWLMEYLHLFFDIIFLCYLIAQSIAKTGKKGKKKKQPLPYSGKWQRKLMAWSFCPWTTKLQIVGIIITRRQFRPSFDQFFYNTLFICLKNQSRYYENRLFVIFCCCL